MVHLPTGWCDDAKAGRAPKRARVRNRDRTLLFEDWNADGRCVAVVTFELNNQWWKQLLQTYKV